MGERWRSERWDSLRLLTPNWATRLPGWSYHGPDPDGYLTAAEFADYLGAYAASFTAPVRAATTVTSVERTGSRFTVRTDQGTWRAGSVTIASGWCDSRASRPLRPGSPVDQPADANRLPQSRPAAGRRGADRGRLGDRRALADELAGGRAG